MHHPKSESDSILEQQVDLRTFCTSKEKIVKQFILFFLVAMTISLVHYVFTQSVGSLIEDIFDMLIIFVIWVIYDSKSRDCISYDTEMFTILKNEDTETNHRFEDIVKINYMPYVKLLTITMKQEDTYLDISPIAYNFQELERFLDVLSTHQPITRGFYIPSGIKTRHSLIFGVITLVVFSSLILFVMFASIFLN